MSFDDPETNHEWSLDEGFAFELWTDDDKTLALTYGAASSSTQSAATRVTMLLDDTGTLILEYLTPSPASHPQDVLEDCQALFGS